VAPAVVSTSRCPADARLLTRAGRSRRKPPQSPAGAWRDSLKLNEIEKKSITCMAIRIVAAVTTELRSQQTSSLSHRAAGASNDRNRRCQPDRSSPGPSCLRFPPALQSCHVSACVASGSALQRSASAIRALGRAFPSRHGGATQPTQRPDRWHRRGDHRRGGQLPVGVPGAAGRDRLPGGPADRDARADRDAAGNAGGRIPGPPHPHRALVRPLPLPGAHLLFAHRSGAVHRPESRAGRDHPDLGAGDPAADVGYSGVYSRDGGRGQSGRTGALLPGSPRKSTA
jgi:hypothetical protein